MARRVAGWMLAVSIVAIGSSGASAQNVASGLFADPFSFYYGVYLPRQAALAAQPRVGETIQSYSADRQYSALTERAGLYDPVGNFGVQSFDPLQPLGRRGRERLPRARVGGVVNTNINGQGPATYYSRTGFYHTRLPRGQYNNSNLYSGGGARFGGRGAMGGMGGFGGYGGAFR